MKKLMFFLLLSGVIGFSCITAFAQCDRGNLSQIQCGYYNEGYEDGVKDAQGNRGNDYKRYRNKLDSRLYERFYMQGYEAGFLSISPTGGRWNSAQRDAYDRGYRFGDDDRRNQISRLPARYEGRYDRAYEQYFQQGYFDGFDNRGKQYDSPIGGIQNPYPTPFPSPGQGRGTATGTISWSGRVDNRVNIVIRGSEVTNQPVAGTFRTGFQNMNGVLPRRNSTVSVSKTEGRGTAFVTQQPNRSNNYTAIVQVSDPRGGDDEYRLDIRWQASNVEENYSSGRVTWRGRVDQKANIIISGADVESIDDSNTGLSNVNFNINGYLAARPGTVSVRKRNGRGSVTVLQQPNPENDYTAIVQIFDPAGSSDDYEVEITW